MNRPFAASSSQIPGFLMGQSSTWATAAKQGLGTSYYDPDLGEESSSNVWFTLAGGILTEVYFPTVTQANLQSVQFLVTTESDEASERVKPEEIVLDIESVDTQHHTKPLYTDALVYQQVNTAKNRRYRIIKSYCTDPVQHSLLMHVTFVALEGTVSDYGVYLLVNPAMTSAANNDISQVSFCRGKPCLTTGDDYTNCSIVSTLPFCKGTAVPVEDISSPAVLIKKVNTAPDLMSTNQSVLTTGPSDNVLCGQLPTGRNTNSKFFTFTISIGFGVSESAARHASLSSIEQPFEETLKKYRNGWHGYLQTLLQPDDRVDRTQYLISSMVLKALEDKRHPGAIVASLSIPWGETLSASYGGIGGYRLVWARDLYQIASALKAVGDTKTAARALRYLSDVQQKPDGSFPQNGWLDGRPYWDGLQLDEVALPILLAYQLQDFSYYDRLVKPAANFLLKNGPATPQERWEENAGLSPSTLASEIAALVVAAEFARFHKDYQAACLYLTAADDWADKIEDWTTTRTGPYDSNRYYFRIGEAQSADVPEAIVIKNGGGIHPKQEIVDAGFLELVRLGIKSADDPVIVRSLNIVDDLLRRDTPHGPVWYRYNWDGYGEKTDGAPYDGEGVGRLWPVLSGERGEYEIAFAASSKQHVPKHFYGPSYLLSSMAHFANDGRMIPEQVWDDLWDKEHTLKHGEGTGGATPLAWSMAQYLRLAACIKAGEVIEMPTAVKDRYQRPERDKTIVFELHTQGVQNKRRFQLKGRTVPDATVFLRAAKSNDGRGVNSNAVIAETKSDTSGCFTLCIAFHRPGRHDFQLMAYDNLWSVETILLTYQYRPPLFLEIGGALSHLHRFGVIEYPRNPIFKEGDFQLQRVSFSYDDMNLYVAITLGHLDNPWNGPSGLSKQVIDIYIDTDAIPRSGQPHTLFQHRKFAEESAWEKCIHVSGNWNGDSRVYNSDESDAGPVLMYADASTSTLFLSVPLQSLGGKPEPYWGFMVLIGGESYGQLRRLQSDADEWNFGCKHVDIEEPSFVDLVLPSNLAATPAIVFNPAWVLPMVRAEVLRQINVNKT